MNQQIIIKFKTGDRDFEGAATERLNTIVGHHVFNEVQPLFPGDPDKEISSVYIATVAGNPAMSEILDLLNRRTEIDYAHLPSERKGM